MKSVVSKQKRSATSWLAMLFLCLASTVAASDSYTSPENIDGAQKIEAEGLIRLVNQDKARIIIDSRISSDRKLGYIPDSISLPDTETSCESLARIIPQKSDPVVFYCNGPKCRRSDNAVVIAANCGYTNIYWFRGGIEAWRANNYPVKK
jgi:rhodanese-related sulfurtransferase